MMEITLNADIIAPFLLCVCRRYSRKMKEAIDMPHPAKQRNPLTSQALLRVCHSRQKYVFSTTVEVSSTQVKV